MTRRADRLYQLIDILRGGRVVTARTLSDRLEVSERTIYRDIADLVGSGVPITGEAGVGYVLDSDFDLPPLMFDADEVTALVLGTRMAALYTDPALSAAAGRVLEKVAAVLPEGMRPLVAESRLDARGHSDAGAMSHLSTLRSAIDDRRPIRIRYAALNGQDTVRTVRPLGLALFTPHWLLAAWCALRLDFRAFRVDRIRDLTVTDGRFPVEPGRELADFQRAHIGDGS